MTKLARKAAGFLIAASTLLAASAWAAPAVDETAEIIELLRTYEQVLNAGDVAGVMQLYTADGVFMPQNNASQVGADAVRAAYEGAFATINLDVAFEIVEVVQIGPDWAFARTNSAGTITVLANGAQLPEANQELFVLRKQPDGTWKIARYAFSTTNPQG